MNKAKNIAFGVAAILLLSGVFVYFPSWASLLFLVGAIIALPVKQVSGFLEGKGLSGGIKIAIIVALFLAGAIIAPEKAGEAEPPASTPTPTTEQTAEPTPDPTPSQTTTTTPTPTPTPAPTPATTPAPAPTPTAEPEEQKVWISSSGSRYHRKSNCSGMNNPSQVTIGEAEAMGLTPCGRCY